MQKNKTHAPYCCVAGCSGGHITPCLTLANKKRAPHQELLFFTTDRPLDKKLLHDAQQTMPHVTHTALPLGHLSRKPLRLPFTLWNLVRSSVISFFQLAKQRPEVVITTGSHIALPVCIAAWLLRIPIDLYEVNVLPGKAMHALAPFARTIYICYGTTAQAFHGHSEKCKRTSYPLPFSKKEKQSRATARQKLDLATNVKTLLILGGSQGSLFINTQIKKLVEDEPPLCNQLQIIHQTGSTDTTDWQNFYTNHNIRALVFPYHDTIKDLYTAADCIICRAGAGTLAECIFFERPTITLPLTTATTDHQVANAHAAASEHPDLITVLEQGQVTTKKLARLIKQKS